MREELRVRDIAAYLRAMGCVIAMIIVRTSGGSENRGSFCAASRRSSDSKEAWWQLLRVKSGGPISQNPWVVNPVTADR